MRKLCVLLLIITIATVLNAEILIPMDEVQTDHLKAYGVAFEGLKEGLVVKWLLNYRAGSWVMPESSTIESICRVRGVFYEKIGSAQYAAILQEIEGANMDAIVLEKEPKIAVYAPPNSQPWDDAVRLALDYAQIDHEIIWDEEVLQGKLEDYDWVHLHHEDFTGQYGKFYRSFRNAAWYQEEVRLDEETAQNLGYSTVWQLKHDVAETIREYVRNGGFLFAMCAATDTFDIALAAKDTDIVDVVYDGTPPEPGYQRKLDYSRCFAFENFSLITDPNVYEFSSIDASDYAKLRGAEQDYFLLFDFSAKYDPVPTMLTQCHTNYINGFLGQTTTFHKNNVKKSVIIMGEVPGADEVKYLHGNFGKGTFTFYGGHDPEDYQHRVGDPPSVLALHKNSPGYRLILNNVLFPAAEKKKLKT